MRIPTLTLALTFCVSPALAAEGVPPPAVDTKTYLEGEWQGVAVDTNANKLCTDESSGATVLTFEFARSGGAALFDNGVQEESGRRRVASVDGANNLMSVLLDGQTAAMDFRRDGADRMTLVRSSASLGMPVDVMVFKRCRGAADRSEIALEADAAKAIAADFPGEQPYFVDARIAAKVKDACVAPKVQYVFFGLFGPSEFRVSRWNSFDLADALATGQKAGLPLDAVGDWDILSAEAKNGATVLYVRERDKPEAAAQTLTLQSGPGGRLAIPEWKREYVRCTGFDKRA